MGNNLKQMNPLDYMGNTPSPIQMNLITEQYLYSTSFLTIPI